MSDLPLRSEDYFILDVRDEEEYEKKHIKGSHNIPYRMILVAECPGAIGHALKKIPKDKTILMFCSTGKRSRLAEKVLLRKGYDVFNIMSFEHAEDFINSLKVINKNE